MGTGDLRELIARHQGDRSFERLARDSHGIPTKGRWHQLATGPIKNFPDPETIYGVARALGVTVTEVVMAAARSLGIEVREDSHGALSTAGLNEDQVHVVRLVIAALAATSKEATSDGPPIAQLETHEFETPEGPALEIREEPTPKRLSRTGDKSKQGRKDTQGKV